MKKNVVIFMMTIMMALTGCRFNQGEMLAESPAEKMEEADSSFQAIQEDDTDEKMQEESETVKSANKMTVGVGGQSFTASLEENEASFEFIEMLQEGPITINMRDYSGFEKVGAIGQNLTTSDEHIATAAGDIVLYNGNQIVIFYGSNSWSYTKLGKIDNLTGWNAALGSGDVSVTFSINK